mgnify:CR=1 FL=1
MDNHISITIDDNNIDGIQGEWKITSDEIEDVFINIKRLNSVIDFLMRQLVGDADAFGDQGDLAATLRASRRRTVSYTHLTLPTNREV